MIAIAVTFAATSASAATPVIFNNHTYNTNTQFSVVADMDGDGHPDIVSAAGSAVNVLLNDGTGMFLNPGNNYFPTPSAGETEIAICSVAVGDFNGDGINDVAASDCGSGVVHLFVNDGSGRLTFLKDLGPIGGGAFSVVMADLNGDGKLDVIAASTNIEVFLNQGGGNFTAPSTISLGNSQGLTSLTTGDINGDGKIDLAVLAGSGTSNAQVYQILNQTVSGSFNLQFTSTLVETGTGRSVLLADIDKDGHADLLVAFGPPTGCVSGCITSGVSWFFNNADGTRTKGGYLFNSPGGFFIGGGGVAVGDFNHDGLNDIAITVDGGRAESGDQIRYMLGTGPRSFSAAQPNENAGRFGARGIVAADLNGDGQSDLVVTDITSGDDDVKFAIVGSQPWGQADSEFCAPPAPGIWNICSPRAGQTYEGNGATPIYFDAVATAPSGQSVLSTQVYIDGQVYDTSNNRGMIGMQSVVGGSHTILFRALLSGGGQMDKSTTFTVGSGGCTVPSTASVVICTPTANADVTNPVTFTASAGAPSGETITAMKLYIDGVSKASSSGNQLSASLTLTEGVHNVTVNAWTNTGVVEKRAESITVTGTNGGGGGCIPSSAQSSLLCSPANGSTVSSPVNVVAGSRAASGSFIYSMRVYIDGVSKVTVTNPTSQGTAQQINVSIPVSTGTHKVSVVTYESNGATTMNVSDTFAVR